MSPSVLPVATLAPMGAGSEAAPALCSVVAAAVVAPPLGTNRWPLLVGIVAGGLVSAALRRVLRAGGGGLGGGVLG